MTREERRAWAVRIYGAANYAAFWARQDGTKNPTEAAYDVMEAAVLDLESEIGREMFATFAEVARRA
jgi:hypothetical protein